MSTRATYKIEGQVFYIHYDGYPEGAARYFFNLADCDNLRGGFAERFIRSNDLAEFTASHDAHGDTEFRYTLTSNGQLKAEERIDFSDVWSTFFTGEVSDFINSNINDSDCCLTILSNGRLTTLDKLEEELSNELNNAERMYLGGHTGNASSSYQAAWRIYTLIAESTNKLNQTVENRIKSVTPYFTTKFDWVMDDAVEKWNNSFYPAPSVNI